MEQHRKEVEIPVPFPKLVETVCNLPLEDLAEVKRQIESRLQGKDTGHSTSDEAIEDAEFWNSEFGRLVLAEADPDISMEAVLKATSRIRGSLAAEAIAERDER